MRQAAISDRIAGVNTRPPARRAAVPICGRGPASRPDRRPAATAQAIGGRGDPPAHPSAPAGPAIRRSPRRARRRRRTTAAAAIRAEGPDICRCAKETVGAAGKRFGARPCTHARPHTHARLATTSMRYAPASRPTDGPHWHRMHADGTFGQLRRRPALHVPSGPPVPPRQGQTTARVLLPRSPRGPRPPRAARRCPSGRSAPS